MVKFVFGLIGVFLLVGTLFLGFGLFSRSAVKITDTVVENEVYERSYQKQAGKRERIAIEEANLVEIEMKLSNQNLDDDTRRNLEAQASAARIRLQVAKEN